MSKRAQSNVPIRAAPSLVVVAVTAFVMAGCGGSSGENGIASKSAGEILSGAQAAAAGATSVHIQAKSGASTLDVRVSSAAGSARVSVMETYEVIRIGETAYFRGDRSFLRAAGISAPPGTWVKAPASDPSVRALVAFTEPGEVRNLLRLEGQLGKGGRANVNGHKVIELTQRGGIYTGSLYVSRTGKPYAVAAIRRGAGAGSTTFSEWDQPITLSAPAKTIDINQVRAAG